MDFYKVPPLLLKLPDMITSVIIDKKIKYVKRTGVRISCSVLLMSEKTFKKLDLKIKSAL